jgi:hypothetical protein
VTMPSDMPLRKPHWWGHDGCAGSVETFSYRYWTGSRRRPEVDESALTFSIEGPPNPTFAQQLMHSEEYIQRKQRIMRLKRNF